MANMDKENSKSKRFISIDFCIKRSKSDNCYGLKLLLYDKRSIVTRSLHFKKTESQQSQQDRKRKSMKPKLIFRTSKLSVLP